MAPLGLIAGAGALPRRILQALAYQSRPAFVVALEGQCDAETVLSVPHAWHRLGAAGAILASLRSAGVQDLVMAGKVERPSLLTLAPDAVGVAMLARIGWRALGDDGLLRAVTAELEAQGFRVLSPATVLAESVAPLGRWGQHAPDDWAQRDRDRGFAVVAALGVADVGQAVVVQQGLVLAVEAAEGTDAMIARAASLARPGPRPVLIKAAKPTQDMRLDPPVIGPHTIATCSAAGFAGVAVEAGRVMVVDLPQVIGEADRLGLFLEGVASCVSS
ncbi:MAG: LpxI family protein [Alphaproteobacteria bacterium]|nr:UDP-2,3-diacylglucosamine diphosphatase LpxI [Alphaproteobacteria bacterium]TAD92023.1 MAG: LpxI family protein [Alphaproteobacteria bacterium]